MNKSLLDQFRMSVIEQKLGIYGIKVENINGESISHYWRADDTVCLYSASKTFAALAVGLCMEEVQITSKDKILGYFPEYQSIAAEGSEKITIRDLLHMSSGKLEFWFGEDQKAKYEKDWAELFFKVPVTKKPGTYFYYSNACTYMLGRIVERMSGQNVRDFLMKRLFIPLEIFNPQWHTCPQGHTLAATGLYLTLDEFSKLGMLLLNKGVCKGKRIVSEDYLEQMISDTIDSKRIDPTNPNNASGYGYQVWKCAYEGAYRADGKYGQLCIVIPDKETVITVTAHEEKAKHDVVPILFRDIVSQL